MRRILIVATLALASVLGAGETPPVALAERHRVNGLACADCHGKDPKKPPETAMCLGCHESHAKVAERTKGLKPNPHDNHVNNPTFAGDCSDCHRGHKALELMCRSCHMDMKFERK